MPGLFLSLHMWWQYAVLVAVIVALVFAYRGSMMDATSERVYRLTAVVVDIQVALGIVIWLATSAWQLSFLQAWIHPIVGLAALGVLHAFIGRARTGPPEVANRTVRIGLIIASALVLAAIGLAEMA